MTYFPIGPGRVPDAAGWKASANIESCRSSFIIVSKLVTTPPFDWALQERTYTGLGGFSRRIRGKELKIGLGDTGAVPAIYLFRLFSDYFFDYSFLSSRSLQ